MESSSAQSGSVSRRHYLRLSVLALGGVALGGRGTGSRSETIRYRIEPLEGYAYRPSFRRVVKGREFGSVAQAVRFVKHPSIPFKVVRI